MEIGGAGMSKKTCYECENCIYPPMCDNTLCPISDVNFAEACCGFTQIHKLPKTVFDHITTSPEVLAPYFVMADFDDSFFPWLSTLTNEPFKTYEDAIAATVAKLKEVCDD